MSTKLTAAEKKKQAAAEQAAAEQAAAEQAAAEQAAAEQAAAEQAAAEQAAADAAKPALRRRASNIKAVRATAGDVLVCGTLRITREGVELGKVTNKMMKHIEYGIAVGTLERVK